MATVLRMVEKQIALWELKRRWEDLRQRPGRHWKGGVGYGPCLVVSRQRGSGGSQLARLVGQRLGWHVFDREILDEIGRLAHVRLQVLESVDEPIRASWEDAWRAGLAPADIGCDAYFTYLRQVVMTLGHHGDVVILGRGAQYVLPSGCALRVRVVAPLSVRVQRVAERAGLSLEQAQKDIEEFDAQRAAFVREGFQADLGSPLNYDLVLNTAEISLEAGAELAFLALRDKLGVQTHG